MNANIAEMINIHADPNPIDAFITIQNAGLRLKIQPQDGGKISELFAVSLGRNLLAEASPEAILTLENERRFSVSGWMRLSPLWNPGVRYRLWAMPGERQGTAPSVRNDDVNSGLQMAAVDIFV
jgi:hypothetical protein